MQLRQAKDIDRDGTTINRATECDCGSSDQRHRSIGAGGDRARPAPPQLQVPTEEQLQPGEMRPGRGPGLFGGLARSNFLLGDMWGLRPFLAQYGMSLALQETSEVLGNVTGGAHRGFDYDGLTQMLACNSIPTAPSAGTAARSTSARCKSTAAT